MSVPRLLVAIVAIALAGCGSEWDAGERGAAGTTPRTARGCAGPLVDPGGAQGVPFRCSPLPARARPRGALSARAWKVPTDSFTRTGRFRRGPAIFLVGWTGSRSGYAVWRRRSGRWERAFSAFGMRGGAVPSAWFSDVTADGRPDALVEEANGSGACGNRTVLALEPRAVRRIFRASTCELRSSLEDGLLYFREPVGTCPGEQAHCYQGVRITIRGWSGAEVTTDQVIVRCSRARFDPARDCNG